MKIKFINRASDISPPHLLESQLLISFLKHKIIIMKKTILLFFIASAFYNHADCQITKGNWMIGGAASFKSSKYDFGGVSSKQTLVQLSGDVGYFIIDKFAIGLKLGYERTGINGSSNPLNNVNANTYNIGPFARYYFLPAEKYVNIFSELSYQYGLMKTSQGASQNSNNFSGLVGCAAFFNSSVALEFTLGYSSYLYNNNAGKVNNVIAGIGFHFHLEKEQ